MDAEADLSLRWAHMPFCWFSHEAANFSSSTSTSFRTLLGHTSSTAEFTITFSRKYSYYLLNMLLPVLFLIILSVLVFILPAEAGEKIGYSLTILLSLSVMMTLVSDSIPPTSTATCILSKYTQTDLAFLTGNEGNDKNAVCDILG